MTLKGFWARWQNVPRVVTCNYCGMPVIHMLDGTTYEWVRFQKHDFPCWHSGQPKEPGFKKIDGEWYEAA